MIEYRIIWDDDGNGNPSAGNWSAVDNTFEHNKAAAQNAGEKWNGQGSIWVGAASRVEFRKV